MKIFILLICLLFSSFAHAEVYAKYYSYYSGSTVLLTDSYIACPTYDKPLMSIMVDSDGHIIKMGCYGLYNEDVSVQWDDFPYITYFYPANYFTILIP